MDKEEKGDGRGDKGSDNSDESDFSANRVFLFFFETEYSLFARQSLALHERTEYHRHELSGIIH